MGRIRKLVKDLSKPWEYSEGDNALLVRFNQKKPLGECMQDSKIGKLETLVGTRVSPLGFEYGGERYVGYLFPPSKGAHDYFREYLTNHILKIPKEIRRKIIVQIIGVAGIKKERLKGYKDIMKLGIKYKNLPDTVYFLVAERVRSLREVLSSYDWSFVEKFNRNWQVPGSFSYLLKGVGTLLGRLRKAGLFYYWAGEFIPQNILVLDIHCLEMRLIDVYDPYKGMAGGSLLKDDFLENAKQLRAVAKHISGGILHYTPRGKDMAALRSFIEKRIFDEAIRVSSK